MYSIISPLILLFSVLIFDLFWVVFCYNLLYVSTFLYDTEGWLYSVALKQLFTEIYIMKLCLIGLFLSIHNDWDKFSDIDQAAIMIIVTMTIIIYQLVLRNTFALILKYLSAFMNNRDEKEKSKHEYSLAGAVGSLCCLVHTDYDWMMSFKRLSWDLQESIYELTQNQLNILNQCGYEHEADHHCSPVVWILKDHLKISEDEITHIRDCIQDVKISNELAELDMKVRVKLSQNACDINVI